MEKKMKKVEFFRANIYKNFVPLKEVVPLETPFTVKIDPTNMCNFRCRFCPTGHPDIIRKSGRPSGKMDFSLFKKIIDDLKDFDQKIKKLNLYKDGEPLLNKKLPKFVAYAKKSNVAKVVSTTTNAALLNKETALQLLEAGLDHIRISIEHVNSSGYKSITQNFSDYTKILKNVEYLYNLKRKRKMPLTVNVKLLDTGFSEHEVQKFYDDFQDISDLINIEALQGLNNMGDFDFRLGKRSDVGTDGFTKLKKSRKACPQPFYIMAINFDGQVSPCAVDWNWSLIVGDAKKHHMKDIWQGVPLHELRVAHLKGLRSTIPSCANCQAIEGDRECGDLDDISEELVKVFSGKKAVDIQ